jgi:regulator of protease activity HflC (stomatin/prohibitin superfamily)
MLFLRRVLVGDQERALLIRDGRFERMLGPGAHNVWSFGAAIQLERHNVGEVVLAGPWVNHLVKVRPEVTAEHFAVVETNDSQVAVVSLDGKVARAFGPGARALFWRGPVEVSAEVFDANAEPEVPARLAATLIRSGFSTLVTATVVDDGKIGLLFLDGRFVRTLAPGTHAFWNAGRNPRVEVIDLRIQMLEISGQEILTKDKVSIRVNVWAEFQVTDAVAAKQTVSNHSQALHRVLQFAVRRTLGRRTLDEILAERVDIDDSVAAEVRAEAETFGVRMGAMGLKDIVLPGEVRDILNQVVTAEKQAQANLIRRREETAATRSLLNTAKLMEDNPLLVRLKELETLEKVSEKVEKITVLGGFDGLLNQVLTLRGG